MENKKAQQASQEWLQQGKDWVLHHHYEEALAAFEQALRFSPTDARAYAYKGTA